MSSDSPRSISPPSITVTPDDAREYSTIVHESFRETRALYENYVYRDGQTLDKKLWKAVRTVGTTRIYRRRSGSSDATPASASSLGSSGVSTGQTGATADSASSQSSPDPMDDDTMFIGPSSSLSVASKIPVMLSIGVVQGTVDDLMYGTFMNSTASLRQRSMYEKNRLEDSVVLSALEGPMEEDPFHFLGLAWLLRSFPGLGAVVRQRDFLVLYNSGLSTTSHGARLGYNVTQSVTHRDLPEFKEQGIVRASISLCALYRQITDQSVEVFMQVVVNPGGVALPFLMVQETATSIADMSDAIETAHCRKLSWYLRNARTSSGLPDLASLSLSLSSSNSSSSATERTPPEQASHCAHCQKPIGKLFSVTSAPCRICHEWTCKHCSVTKDLVVHSSKAKWGMGTRAYSFCLSCFLQAKNHSAEEIQRHEVLSKRYS